MSTDPTLTIAGTVKRRRKATITPQEEARMCGAEAIALAAKEAKMRSHELPQGEAISMARRRRAEGDLLEAGVYYVVERNLHGLSAEEASEWDETAEALGADLLARGVIAPWWRA